MFVMNLIEFVISYATIATLIASVEIPATQSDRRIRTSRRTRFGSPLRSKIPASSAVTSSSLFSGVRYPDADFQVSIDSCWSDLCSGAYPAAFTEPFRFCFVR